MSDLPSWTQDSFAVWIKGKAELKECQRFLNKILIQSSKKGLDIEALQGFSEAEELMRNPEYNDLIFDNGRYCLPRNFIRLIPVIRWPLIRECFKEEF